MRLLPRSLAIKASIVYLVSLSNLIFCTEFEPETMIKPDSSVSVCLFALGNDIAEAFVFKKAKMGYWFKSGRLDTREKDAYRTDDEYNIYPHGYPAKQVKNPGEYVFPCGASGGVGMSGETIKAAALREFAEETGVDLKTYNLEYKAFSLEDGKGVFYVLYCRIKGTKDVQLQTKDDLFSMMQENFAEKNFCKTPDVLLPPRTKFEPEPKISHDELDMVELVDFRKLSIETKCERSRLAYKHLVTIDSKRSRPTKKAIEAEDTKVSATGS